MWLKWRYMAVKYEIGHKSRDWILWDHAGHMKNVSIYHKSNGKTISIFSGEVTCSFVIWKDCLLKSKGLLEKKKRKKFSKMIIVCYTVLPLLCILETWNSLKQLKQILSIKCSIFGSLSPSFASLQRVSRCKHSHYPWVATGLWQNGFSHSFLT